MSLQRISVSRPLADPGADPEAFVPVFHDWIRRQAVEGLLVDVASYAHVPHGPGVLLVGHEGDYSVDMLGGAPALRYTLKRDLPEEPREAVALALRRLEGATAEASALDSGGVVEDRLTVRIFDRLNAPNTEEAFAAFAEQIEAGVREIVGPDARLSLTRESDDHRAPLELTFTIA